MSETRLAVVGGGNMAQAILLGALDTGALKPEHILVAEPDEDKRRIFTKLGVRAVERASQFPEPMPAGAQVLLAVKPQYLAEAATDLAGRADGSVVISILAGSTSQRVQQAVGQRARIIRVMPNLPARVRCGVTAIALGAGAKERDGELAEKLFSAVGEVVRLEESLMDAFTAIAGSGPAYVFYLAQAMARAACEMGFDEATALPIIRQTILGAGQLLKESTDDPAALRAAVTSKKGTTDAAITSLEQAGVMDSIVRAVVAARDRGADLAKY